MQAVQGRCKRKTLWQLNNQQGDYYDPWLG